MISNDLKTRLETVYSLGSIYSASNLEGGYWNTVLLLKSDKGHFVLRISHPSTNPEGIAYEHSLTRYMNRHIPEVPAPLVLNEGDGATYFLHEGRIITLFPFMPGTIADRSHEVDRDQAAIMLAKLHQAALRFPSRDPRPGHPSLKQLDWDQNPIWDWGQIKPILFGNSNVWTEFIARMPEEKQTDALAVLQKRNLIEQQREAIRSWVTNLASSNRALLFAPTHGDYYRGNLLFVKHKVTAVIDWDECRPEWLSFELARATWEFCKNKENHTLDITKAHRFIQSYQDAGGPVSSSEYDLLIPFMRSVRLMEVLSALGQAVRGEDWDPDYHLHNLLSLENLQGAEIF